MEGLPVDYVRARAITERVAFPEAIGASIRMTVVDSLGEKKRLWLSKEAVKALSTRPPDSFTAIKLYENRSIYYTAE